MSATAQAVSIDVDLLAHLPAKTMLRLIEKQQTVARHIAAFNRCIPILAPMLLQLEAWDIDPGFDLVNGTIDVMFTGDGDKFGDVWGALRRQGFRPADRPQPGATGFSGFFNHDHLPRVYMSFSSSVCRRIAVGTRMVEQTIYETQCGPDLALPDELPGDLPAPSAAPDLGEGESL